MRCKKITIAILAMSIHPMLHASTTDFNEKSVLFFSNSKDAKQIVHAAHKNLISVDDLLQDMRQLSINASNATNSVEERYKLNDKFQRLLLKFNQQMKKNKTVYLSNIAQGDVNIDLRGESYHYLFNIKLYDLHQDMPRQLTTENANTCLDVLYYAKEKLEQSLPKSTDIGDLLKFENNENQDNNDSDNAFFIKNEANQKILEAMVDSHYQIDHLLDSLIDLSEKAAKKPADIESLNAQYTQILSEYNRAYKYLSLKFNLPIFNNNNLLKFKLDNRQYQYTFSKLILNPNQDKPLDLLSTKSSQRAIKKIDKLREKIQTWEIEHS